MINIKLQQLLPAQISDEAAFQLVLFFKDLATTLEANYFDKMLHHTSSYEYNQSRANQTEENDTPF
jgi:hypothetical protein